ncbi:hypothetical protein EBB07_02760 [Paenibacillaceae bacterium]|nr:hypothetical protein EBB07_02760 [Paenibacillaceae bacterium]
MTTSRRKFSPEEKARICGRLGIRLVHSRPYRPMGRGKVERLFQFVDSSFRPEVQALVNSGEVTTLEALNTALRSWLDGYYHTRENGSTKQSPRERFEASQRPRKRLPLVELNELFLWEETRKVDKTGCVRLDGNLYEVDSDLARRSVILRYDPFDLSQVQVWDGERRFADATPVELNRRRSHRAAIIDAEVPEASVAERLSFLALAEQKRQAAWSANELRFAEKGGDGK